MISRLTQYGNRENVNAIPAGFVSNTSIAGYVVDQSHGAGSYPEAFVVFNRNSSSGDYAWFSGNIGISAANPAWFSIEVPEAFVPAGIHIMNEIQTPENFKTAIFQGSDNGSSWEDIYTVNDNPNQAGYAQDCFFECDRPYKYFRMFFTASHASGVSVQMFKIYRTTGNVTSLGFDRWGFLKRFESVSLAGCLMSNIPSEGLIFYDPLDGVSANTPVTGPEYTEIYPPVYTELSGVPCAEFNPDQRLKAANCDGFPANGFTLSIWFHQRGSDPGNLMFGYGSDSRYGVCMLRMDNYSSGGFGIERGSGQHYSGVSIMDGKWHHCACVIGESGNNILYLDGNAVLEFEALFNVTAGNIAVSSFISGGYTASQYLAAARIYDRVLNSDEIRALAGEFKV